MFYTPDEENLRCVELVSMGSKRLVPVFATNDDEVFAITYRCTRKLGGRISVNSPIVVVHEKILKSAPIWDFLVYHELGHIKLFDNIKSEDMLYGDEHIELVVEMCCDLFASKACGRYVSSLFCEFSKGCINKCLTPEGVRYNRLRCKAIKRSIDGKTDFDKMFKYLNKLVEERKNDNI